MQVNESSDAIISLEKYCPACDKHFRRPAELLRHLSDTLAHNRNARRYPCRYCKQRFTKTSSVTLHIKNVHGLELRPLQSRKRGLRSKKRHGDTQQIIRREASPVISSSSTLPNSRDSPLNEEPSNGSARPVAPFGDTNFGGGHFFPNNFSPIPEAVPPASSYNFTFGGLSSFTPGPSTVPQSTAPEVGGMEGGVLAYPGCFGLHSTPLFPGPSAFPTVHGPQYPPFVPQTYNNVHGSLSLNQFWALHNTRVPSEQEMKLIEETRERLRFSPGLYTPQQQYYQQPFQCYQPPQSSPVNNGMDNQLSIATPSEQYQPQQQPLSLPNLCDEFAHLSTGAPY